MFLRSQLEERPTAERAIRELGEAVVSRVRLSIAISSMIIKRRITVSDDLELRDAIQKIALEMRSYGYRPITKETASTGAKSQSQACFAPDARR